MQLLAIGSILQKEEEKAVVIGYHFETIENRFQYSYIVTGYPMGVLSKESIGIVPVEADMEILFAGYQDDNFQRFIKNKNELYHLTKNKTVEECNEEIEKVNELLRREVMGK